MKKLIELLKILREVKIESSRAATLISYRQLKLVIKPNNIEVWVTGNLWLEPHYLFLCSKQENTQDVLRLYENCELTAGTTRTRT